VCCITQNSSLPVDLPYIFPPKFYPISSLRLANGPAAIAWEVSEPYKLARSFRLYKRTRRKRSLSAIYKSATCFAILCILHLPLWRLTSSEQTWQTPDPRAPCASHTVIICRPPHVDIYGALLSCNYFHGIIILRKFCKINYGKYFNSPSFPTLKKLQGKKDKYDIPCCYARYQVECPVRSASCYKYDRPGLTFKDEAYLFYIRIQLVPRCKHSPLRL
jgi:hypothetical protein